MDNSHTLPGAIDEAAKLLSNFIVPLYTSDGGGARPLPYATGFLVQAGTDCFLVSAAHVLERLNSASLYYYISATVTRKVTGVVLLNPWIGDRRNDPVDIGVVKLSNEALPPYPDVRKYAMDVSYLKHGLAREPHNYLILGFPASRTKVNPVAREVGATAYGHHSTSAHPDEYVRLNLDARMNLLLPLDLKRSFDLVGEPRSFPRPQGMSGSPVWALYSDSREDDCQIFPVVAVGTKYLKRRRLIVATDVGVVLAMIERLSGQVSVGRRAGQG